MQTVEYGQYKWIDDFSKETIEGAKKDLWEWFEEIKNNGDGMIHSFEWDIKIEIEPLTNQEMMALTLRFKRDEV